jgi:hypothetical protein
MEIYPEMFDVHASVHEAWPMIYPEMFDVHASVHEAWPYSVVCIIQYQRRNVVLAGRKIYVLGVAPFVQIF